MVRWFLMRLSWLLLTLLGVTFVTFAVLDHAPVDRAAAEVARRAQELGFSDPASRDAAILQLRVHYGMVDPTTLEPAPLLDRYFAWLENAARLRFAGPREDHAAFWRRLASALPVSAWLGFLALALAFGIGLPLGAWCGMRTGSRGDRAVSRVMFVLIGVPEFLLGALLVLLLVGSWQWFPAAGLASDGAAEWGFFLRALDFVWHLVLPVGVMSVAPLILVARFVRDSVARANTTPFAASLRALGMPPEVIRRRLLRNGLAPAATLAGSLLPLLVGGSIVVENLFSLDGLGHLAFSAVLRQDQAMVMALVVVTSLVTLSALLASDVLHRIVDPRVRLVR